jgi:hypothetical protein
VTESGIEIVTNDTQSAKARLGISLSVEPCSNIKVARLEQRQKHELPILFVNFGSVNDFKDEQLQKHDDLILVVTLGMVGDSIKDEHP